MVLTLAQFLHATAKNASLREQRTHNNRGTSPAHHAAQDDSKPTQHIDSRRTRAAVVREAVGLLTRHWALEQPTGQ
jgi:hypothetical protein